MRVVEVEEEEGTEVVRGGGWGAVKEEKVDEEKIKENNDCYTKDERKLFNDGLEKGKEIMRNIFIGGGKW